MKNNEKEFHKAMLGIYEAALSECGYRATRFRLIVAAKGGVDAAKTLLRTGDKYQDGLATLCLHGRLDLSMEALILTPQHSSLFTAEELAIAQKRLRGVGYLFPEPERT